MLPGPHFPFTPNQRYPDPSIQVLDPAFLKYRIYSSTVEQVGSGLRWAEGPVYFPGGKPGEPGYLLVSDIPNDRIMKFDEGTGAFTVFREPSNHANGNTRDREGRLVSCEHGSRRVTRTEKDGSITVLADAFEGKRLNSPNDIVVKSDDSVWFTDPSFGIMGEWEGSRATPEQATTNVYRIAPDGGITAVITELKMPNGLAFSPDESKLYVVESRAVPLRAIWSWDIGADGKTLSNKTRVIEADDNGSPDGFRVDRDGNLWCGWGRNGALADEPVELNGRKVYVPKGRSEDLDGVKVFDPTGKPIGFIRLPERCANLCFGGPKNNRVYMAASHSVYALYVEAQGAT
jgi:gluconolactonase